MKPSRIGGGVRLQGTTIGYALANPLALPHGAADDYLSLPHPSPVPA